MNFKKVDKLLAKAELINECCWCNKSLKNINDVDKILLFIGKKLFAFCSLKCLLKLEKHELKTR